MLYRRGRNACSRSGNMHMAFHDWNSSKAPGKSHPSVYIAADTEKGRIYRPTFSAGLHAVASLINLPDCI